MFDSKVLYALAKTHESTFKKLSAVERVMNNRFSHAREAVHAIVLAAASGEPLLLIGPPGTGKSRLIRAFCGQVGVIDENAPLESDDGYFEYLLTPFTEPNELFGFYDIPRAIEGHMERLEAGMMQKARVVYLDEVFNGSSAILNSILAFLNERVFHDRGVRKPTAMECLFAATNAVPETQELRAVFDRFVLRCHVSNVDPGPKAIGNLIAKGWVETFARNEHDERLFTLLDELAAFRKEVRECTQQGVLTPKAQDPFYRRLSQLVHHARRYGLSQMSNRRLVKAVWLMLVHRIYEAAVKGEDADQIVMGSNQLKMITRYFLDRVDEETVLKLERAAEH